MTRHITLTTSFLVAFITAALPSVWSFSSPPAFSSTTTNFEILPPLQATKSRQTYDLGLGKNRPVVSKSKNSDSIQQQEQFSNNVQEASRFWIAPEPAVTYPSPLLKSANQQHLKNPATKKKTLPSLQHNRKSEDVVLILTDDVGPYSVRRPQHQQVDPNTIWVEMMIHNAQQEQQQKQQSLRVQPQAA